MYELLVKDDMKYTSYFYCQEYSDEVKDVILALGLEVIEVNLVNDIDYEARISEVLNYPNLMN